MTGQPLVSVISTVFNGERYLEQAVSSICRQTLRDFEYVIVDDGSTDRTTNILDDAQADERIKIITQGRVGRARALNLAWRQTRGKYVANLDVDDMAEPGRLEAQVRFLEQHPDIGLLGTACKIRDEKSGMIRVRRPIETDADLRRALIRHNPIVHSSVMMPRHVLEAVDGYSETHRVAIDYDLWIRIAQRYKLANLSEELLVKRMSPDAYFQNRIGAWTRFRTRLTIRWRAWSTLSKRLSELPAVFDPSGQWRYTRTGKTSRP